MVFGAGHWSWSLDLALWLGLTGCALGYGSGAMVLRSGFGTGLWGLALGFGELGVGS